MISPYPSVRMPGRGRGQMFNWIRDWRRRRAEAEWKRRSSRDRECAGDLRGGAAYLGGPKHQQRSRIGQTVTDGTSAFWLANEPARRIRRYSVREHRTGLLEWHPRSGHYQVSGFGILVVFWPQRCCHNARPKRVPRVGFTRARPRRDPPGARRPADRQHQRLESDQLLELEAVDALRHVHRLPDLHAVAVVQIARSDARRPRRPWLRIPFCEAFSNNPHPPSPGCVDLAEPSPQPVAKGSTAHADYRPAGAAGLSGTSSGAVTRGSDGRSVQARSPR